MQEAGKGSDRRRSQVPQQQLTLNWSNTFGKSKLEQRLEAERLAQQELEQAVQEGIAKFAE